MIARELIDVARIPGGAELKLFRRGADHMIVLDRNELMNSRMSGSEEALATMTVERLGARPAPHLLIGGYGMGFTLRAALKVLGRDARVTVAELVPEIIAWAQGPMRELTAGGLTDPRVRVVEADVGVLIAEARGAYDAVLLDVDNGPDGLVRAANDRLYSADGLAAAKATLRPGGILAIWSAAPDTPFARRLGSAGFAVEEVAVRARANGKGPRHVIWFAGSGRRLDFAGAAPICGAMFSFDLDAADKPELYRQLVDAADAVTAGEADGIANMANLSALLMEALPDLNWAGFYRFDGQELVLGPFQGKAACIRIPLGRGVCGTAAATREVQVVADVHAFPGHIACDAASRSELVVPIVADGALVGVLDLDSPTPGRFDDQDADGCAELVRRLAARLVAVENRRIEG